MYNLLSFPFPFFYLFYFLILRIPAGTDSANIGLSESLPEFSDTLERLKGPVLPRSHNDSHSTLQVALLTLTRLTRCS